MNAVVEIVAPIFAIVLLSFVLARAGVFSPAASDGLTRFMFYVAIPAMLFRTLATTELPVAIPWKYMFAFYGPSFAVFATGILISRYIFLWDRADQGIAAICGSYSNMVMLGFPLVIAAFGDTAAVPLFILLALQSTLIFPATTWVIEIYARDPAGTSSSVLQSLARLFLNPVILSLVLGVGFNLASLEISGPADRVLGSLAAAAPSVALFALGLGLAQYKFRGELESSITLTLLKCIVHPILVWVACWMLNIELLWTQVAVILAAMPTGINAFIFAHKYGTRVSIVTKSILLGTLFSILSVSLLLKYFLSGGVS
jgi:malonate transporter